MIDVVLLEALTQTEVDPNNHSTVVHTGLTLPDGGEGFVIIGRLVRDKKRVWVPLKEVIKQLIVEYQPKYDPIAQESQLPQSPIPPTIEENPVRVAEDTGGQPVDGEQAVSGEPRGDTPSGKGRKRTQKGG